MTLQHATHTLLGAGAHGAAVDAGDEALLRAVVGQQADVWVQIRHLPTGRAPDVAGELAVHRLARARSADRAEDGSRLATYRVNVAPGAEQGLLFRLRAGGAMAAAAGGAGSGSGLGGSTLLPAAWLDAGLSSVEMGVLRDAHASVAAASRAAAFWTPGETPR